MTRTYNKLSNIQRKELIHLVEVDGVKTKTAAKQLDVPYNNAKQIMKIYRKDERVDKVANRQLKVKKQSTSNQIQASYASYKKASIQMARLQALNDVNTPVLLVSAIKQSQNRHVNTKGKKLAKTKRFDKDMTSKKETNVNIDLAESNEQQLSPKLKTCYDTNYSFDDIQQFFGQQKEVEEIQKQKITEQTPSYELVCAKEMFTFDPKDYQNYDVFALRSGVRRLQEISKNVQQTPCKKCQNITVNKEFQMTQNVYEENKGDHF